MHLGVLIVMSINQSLILPLKIPELQRLAKVHISYDTNHHKPCNPICCANNKYTNVNGYHTGNLTMFNIFASSGKHQRYQQISTLLGLSLNSAFFHFHSSWRDCKAPIIEKIFARYHPFPVCIVIMETWPTLQDRSRRTSNAWRASMSRSSYVSVFGCKNIFYICLF